MTPKKGKVNKKVKKPVLGKGLRPNSRKFGKKKKKESKKGTFDVGDTAPGLDEKKKRVSFGKASSSIYDTQASPNTSVLKPILKRKRAASGGESTKSSKRGPFVEKAVENDQTEENAQEQEENSENDQNVDTQSAVDQQKTSLMSRKEGKMHLQKLKAKRRPNYELSKKAKLIWEKLRNVKIDTETRVKLTDELYGLVKGRAKELIFAHDTVRVMQCLMALKNEDIRGKLFSELKDCVVEMSKQKYSKFFVIKMLKYGTPAQRNSILQSMSGKVADLVKHADASEVVEYAYNEYANALQRTQIASEFYGAEFQHFKLETVTDLKQILAKEPQKKEQILKDLFESLTVMTSKPVMKHSLIHRLMLEYLENCSPQSRRDLIGVLVDRVPEMVHTRDGALTAMYCVWFGTAKDRKAIVKSLKGLVTKISHEEHGHWVLLSIFDSVDDTVYVGKMILKELGKNLKDILANKHGMKVVEYLLSPRDSRHFNKQIVATLSIGDANEETKKPREKLHAELLDIISPDLLTYAAENVRQMLFEPSSCLLFALIYEKASGDMSAAYEALCDVLADEFVPCNSEHLHAVEHPHGHYVLSHLLKKDKERFAQGKSTLSETVVRRLTEVQFSSWLTCNKAAFLLVHMMESGVPEAKEKIMQVVSTSQKKLKKYSFSAAKVLLRKLKE